MMQGGQERVGRQRRIFGGNEINVLDGTLPGSEEVLVVSFPARTGRQGLHRPGFGQDFLQRKSISNLLVTVSTNHWFQTHEAGAMVEAIRPIARNYRRVVTYGSSMGGYAALLFAQQLGAHAAIAISPQFSIDRARVPWERRWAEEAKTLKFLNDDMATALRGSRTRITLLYDPRGRDRLHAEQILALSENAASIVVPFGGHPAGSYLRDSKLLSWAIEGLISGHLSESTIRAAVRANRAQSAGYWVGFAHGLHLRRHAAAFETAKRAVDLAPQSANIHFAFSRLCLRMGRLEDALEAAQKAATLAPHVEKYRGEVENLNLKMGGKRVSV